MSMFYHFRVCRSGDAPTVEKKLNFINSDHCRDFQANYLDWTSDSKSKFLVVGDGAQFDKSLVLLSYRLGVAVEDVMYFDAKVAGDPQADQCCKDGNLMGEHPTLEEEPAEVRAVFEGAEWRAANARDYALVAAAASDVGHAFNRGKHRGELQARLARYSVLQSQAHEQCTRREDKFTCYWHDNGCGYPCLDATAGRDAKAQPAATETETETGELKETNEAGTCSGNACNGWAPVAGGPCTANHGKDHPCCGQHDPRKADRKDVRPCPESAPVCVDYVYGKHLGKCAAQEAQAAPAVLPDGGVTPTERSCVSIVPGRVSDLWCQTVCPSAPSNCPAELCTCWNKSEKDLERLRAKLEGVRKDIGAKKEKIHQLRDSDGNETQGHVQKAHDAAGGEMRPRLAAREAEMAARQRAAREKAAREQAARQELERQRQALQALKQAEREKAEAERQAAAETQRQELERQRHELKALRQAARSDSESSDAALTPSERSTSGLR
jgi:hypothetical protein